ncbi:MAG: hypothetical protein HOH43_16500 [Candidatus Latescibacteria bacterium]|nr:hypothetical protein [Candidatus Latescibacterota bacterium]
MDSTTLFFVILVSIVGMGYVYTGKKTSNYAFIVSGMIMMFFPYFITNPIAVAITSIVLIVAPFFYR